MGSYMLISKYHQCVHDYMIFLSNPNFLLKFQTCETASYLAWCGDETVIFSDSIFFRFTSSAIKSQPWVLLNSISPLPLIFRFIYTINSTTLLFPNPFDFQQYPRFLLLLRQWVPFINLKASESVIYVLRCSLYNLKCAISSHISSWNLYSLFLTS